MILLSKELKRKVSKFKNIVKIGRTHLQDATPLTLGQEFSGYNNQVEEGISRIKNSLEEIYFLAQGGTAVGTGINTKKNFDKKIYVHGSYNLQKYVKTITTKLFPIDKSEIILIGRTDSFSRHDVEIIADAFNRGVDVIAMNKDLTFPINDHEFKDGNGAIVREIENLVGSSINSFGKPDSFYSEYLLKQFPQIFAVIGDRVDTDILLAKDIDAKSYLVDSSIKNYLDEDIADFKFDTFSQSVSSIIKNSKN